MASTARPTFEGLAVYRHLRHRFSLLYPEGWAQAKVPRAQGGGVVFTVDPDDRQTSLLVQSRKLPSPVQPEDLDALRDGLLEGVGQLPDVQLLDYKAEAIGKLLDAEAQHTYRDAQSGDLRKRWVRLLCQGAIQISIVAQGSSPEKFEYWLPMFNSVMRTVKFGDWWAEATGHSWRKTLTDPIE